MILYKNQSICIQIKSELFGIVGLSRTFVWVREALGRLHSNGGKNSAIQQENVKTHQVYAADSITATRRNPNIHRAQ